MIANVKVNNYCYNTIKISGSKNSALPIIAASILCNEKVVLKNIPNILDVITLIDLLIEMGYKMNLENNTLTIYPSDIKQTIFKNKKIEKLRGSYYLIGALIGKYTYTDFSFLYPGGCKLGKRPINYHLIAFKQMGLNIKTKKRIIKFRGIKKKAIHNLEFPSVGTTINIILASSKIEEETIINNASIEPEVLDLCKFLNSMGVLISIKNRTITIQGSKYLKSSTYKIMEDRIEAGTFLILGALHKGIKITNINPSNLINETNLLKQIGYDVKINKQSIILKNNETTLNPFNITLEPFPGFPTDLGPLISVLGCKLSNTSTITETVFNNRNSHVKQLKKLNIDIKSIDNTIFVNYSNNIKNSTIKAYDLRCAASLLLAATLTRNTTKIKNIEYLFRGYENIISKLKCLGIDLII